MSEAQRKPPVSKNDDLELVIESLSNEGSGVGRVDGYTVFVVGALPQETVRAHIIKVTPTYAVARIAEILSASPDRVKPACPVFSQCGGCALLHLRYAAQLAEKRRWVVDALTRLGGIEEPNVLPTRGMEDPTRYRNKGSFPFASVNGAAVFGFYAERSHRLVPLNDCLIQDERILAIARQTSAWANENRIAVYDEKTGRGQLRAVVARTSTEGGAMAVIVTQGALRKADSLLAYLEDVDSVWHNENPKDTNVLFGERFTLLRGEPTLVETIADKRFTVAPQSFLQVNPTQTAVLYQAAIELLNPQAHETIADAYCGVGTISLLLASRCKRVVGVEQVSAAIDDARRNAEQNDVTNARFLCANVEDALPRLIANGEQIDALVLDPPRKGCAEEALRAIAKSSAKRLVYVSCNPATLARDCKILSQNGFSLVAAQPVDMFPHTAHVECVALLERGA